MTKLLDSAIAKVQSLPDDVQDEAAEVLLAIASRGREPIPLDPETQEAILQGLEEARHGDFANPEEIAKLLRPRKE